MYVAVLTLHSYVRWFVVLCGLAAVLRALVGVVGHRAWTRGDDLTARLFTIAFDTQVCIGLLLYLSLSPITQAAFRDVGGAMRTAGLRFYFVEHIFGMLVAVAAAHIGWARIRRMADPARRHRSALIWFGTALLVIVASIPWPALPYGRPLLRY